MNKLNKDLVKNKVLLPNIVEYKDTKNLPERIVQFGEGNFLRGFIDWMIHHLNKKGEFNGRVVAIQPTPYGKVVPKLNAQDGLYTLVLQGIEDGDKVEKYEIISSISKGINPYENWVDVLKYAESPEIEFVFSNTTEAGLTYMKEEYHPDKSPQSFPGKLTAFLYHRYQVFSDQKKSGLTIIPIELVDENGTKLKKIILKISEDWNLPHEFQKWIHEHNFFCNTLVDRIVPGYPRDNAKKYKSLLGYEDTLIVVGEPYHLFAIEADERVAESIPFHKVGLNVKWGDVKPYQDLKLRILNAPHTMMFSIGFLAGLDTVFGVMDNDVFSGFIQTAIYEEILPMLPQDEEIKVKFANSVLERFKNPFVKHYLEDIGLNSFLKYRTRVIPMLLKWVKEKRQIPPLMSFSLAALIMYYKPQGLIDDQYMIGRRKEGEYKIRDSNECIRTLYEAWKVFDHSKQNINDVVKKVLRNDQLWGEDLNNIVKLHEVVCDHLGEIFNKGMKDSVINILEKYPTTTS